MANDQPLHNHQRKLLRLQAEGKFPPGPGFWHAHIRHDDWCGIFRGLYCNCDPEIRFVDDATWAKEHPAVADLHRDR